MCLSSEHEKDAERGREVAERRREDAERGPGHVEQGLAKHRCDVCVRPFGKKAERKFEMRLGLVFGEPEKNNIAVGVAPNFPHVSSMLCSTLKGLRSAPNRAPDSE